MGSPKSAVSTKSERGDQESRRQARGQQDPGKQGSKKLGKARLEYEALRFGNLVDEDWKKRHRFERSGDLRLPMPLLEGVACYVVAPSTGKNAVISATGRSAATTWCRWRARSAASESEARLNVRRVAPVGGLFRQPPRSAQPTRSLRANQAMAGCTGLGIRIRHSYEAAARIPPAA